MRQGATTKIGDKVKANNKSGNPEASLDIAVFKDLVLPNNNFAFMRLVCFVIWLLVGAKQTINGTVMTV